MIARIVQGLIGFALYGALMTWAILGGAFPG